jgi:uncharacterized protein YciI
VYGLWPPTTPPTGEDSCCAGTRAGPFADCTGGLILSEHASKKEAERLAAADPFRREGLLERHRLKVWAVD